MSSMKKGNDLETTEMALPSFLKYQRNARWKWTGRRWDLLRVNSMGGKKERAI